MPAAWIALLPAALLTATLSGVLGMGGGVMLLGLMTALLPAAWVVPLHGVVQLCSNLTRTLVFLHHVRWSIFAIYAAPMLGGVTLAAYLWSGAHLGWFKPTIGFFILLFLLWRRFKPVLRNLPLWVYAPLGFAAGFLTLFVGATGPFIAPFFLRDDADNETVIATKAVCQSLGHALKIPAFLALDFDLAPHLPLLAGMIVAVILGTFAGRWLLGKISKRRFVMLFEVLLALIALYLVVGGPRP
jgi:uncharacterized membrane protein YfcA